ncbi:MAG: hypothetical protein AAB444_03085 [Patescibacteria group bacterium]
MRRLLVATLAFAVFFACVAFAGMPWFGMNHDMGGMVVPCQNGYCAPSGVMGSNAADCIEHCLQAASTTASMPVAATFVSALLVLALSSSVFSAKNFIADTVRSFSKHWRDSIGKLFLKQHLSVVILRN